MSKPIDEVPGITDATEIGAGGFGTVYRATQPAFDRTVAVKILRDTVSDDGTRRRFEREARAMGKLSGHPNIVVVHDSGITDSGHPYMVMAYAGGGSLADRILTDGPMPWNQVCAMGVKVAGALATAHEAGILHRDIKPENVLVNDFGEAKLGDFGIARLTGSGATTTGTGVTASIAHAPPEVIDGAPPSAASDVYSLASTLHTLLRGSPPFVKATDESILPILGRIAKEPPPPLPPHVPIEVARAVTAGLAKDPAARPPTAAAFGEGLRAAERATGVAATPLPVKSSLAQAATVAADAAGPPAVPSAQPPTAALPSRPPPYPPPSAPPPSAPPYSGQAAYRPPAPAEAPTRSRTPWVIGGAVAVLAVVGAVVVALSGGRGPVVTASPEPAGVAGPTARGEATEPSVVATVGSPATASTLPSLPPIAYLSTFGDIAEGLYVHDPAGRQLLLEGRFDLASYSPNGERVLLTRFDESVGDLGGNIIEVLEPDGRLTTIVGGGSAESLGAPQWTPDGGRIIFDVFDENGEVLIRSVAADGSGSDVVVRGTSTLLFGGAVSPDGSLVALQRFDEAGPIIAVYPGEAIREEGTPLPLFEFAGDAASFAPDSNALAVTAFDDEFAAPVLTVYSLIDGLVVTDFVDVGFGPPVWLPDGQKLLGTDQSSAVLELNVTTGEVFVLTAPDRTTAIAAATQEHAIYIDFQGDLIALELATGTEHELDGVGGLFGPTLGS